MHVMRFARENSLDAVRVIAGVAAELKTWWLARSSYWCKVVMTCEALMAFMALMAMLS